ncbi:MAG TPA: TlpA disulfide reductase family protein [Polyangiaceae bacterium]|nr:TlpA disulfide reductase family protein [Polyangiaceae bacterium]
MSTGCLSTLKLAPSAEEAPHPLVGARLPSLGDAATLDGQRVAGGAGPVVVKFFASYCRPCMRSLPEMERLHEEHPDVLIVGIDEDDRPDVAADVVRRLGLTFPVVFDDRNALQGRFHVEALPTTFVSDGAGVVRWVGRGEGKAQLAPVIEAARLERAPTTGRAL